MLKLDVCIDIGEAGFGGFDIGFSLRESCAVIAIIDPEQDVTPSHCLVVLDLNGRDIASNLGGEGGHVPADVGVVSRLAP